MQICETALHVFGKGESYCTVVCVWKMKAIGLEREKGIKTSCHIREFGCWTLLWVIEKPVCMCVCL